MKPCELKQQFETHGVDKSDPSLYAMMCWITDANEFSGTTGMTFEEFINYAVFFYSQRGHEEGLQYIWQLFDQDKKGYLTKF